MSQRVAAIDCGTNSLRLLIADVDPARRTLTDVERRMEIVRLGQGVDATGRLAPEALERTLRVLAAVRRRDRGGRGQRGPDGRDQRHPRRQQRGRLHRPACSEALGILPEVISGQEEATPFLHRRDGRAGRHRARPAAAAVPGRRHRRRVDRVRARQRRAGRRPLTRDLGRCRLRPPHRAAPARRSAAAGPRSPRRAPTSTARSTTWPRQSRCRRRGPWWASPGSVTTVTAIALGLRGLRPGQDPSRPAVRPPMYGG